MSNVPLPKVDYDAGWHRQYTSDQMHAHAAAVSAADNAALRAELDEWRFTNKVDELDRHVARQAERIKVLEDALRRCEACTTNDAVGRQARAALEQT